VVERIEVTRVDLERAPVGGERLVVAPELAQREREVRVDVGASRRGREHTAIARDGLVGALELHQRVAEVVERLGRSGFAASARRCAACAFAEAARTKVRKPLVVEKGGEARARFEIVGTKRRGALQRLLGRNDIAGSDERIGQRAPRGVEVRAQRHRAAQRGCAFAKLAARGERCARAGTRHRAMRAHAATSSRSNASASAFRPCARGFERALERGRWNARPDGSCSLPIASTKNKVFSSAMDANAQKKGRRRSGARVRRRRHDGRRRDRVDGELLHRRPRVDEGRIKGTVASSEAARSGCATCASRGRPQRDRRLRCLRRRRRRSDRAPDDGEGGGGALTREKIVAQASRKFVCIADASKLVAVLGKFPLPVEVIPMARSFVGRELVKLGGQPRLRENFTTTTATSSSTSTGSPS
jgi:hypothetical protein